MKNIIGILLCIQSTSHAAVRIVEIENRTPTGMYAIELSAQNRVIIPNATAVTFDDLLDYNIRKNIAMACIQGDYDPIYVELREGIFKCDQQHDSYTASMWVGPQTVFDNQKTIIPLCCKEDASFRLIIHEDGTPELAVVSSAYFM